MTRGPGAEPISPKPVSTTPSSSRTNTCPGLRSPWVRPRRCAARRISRSPSPMRAARTGRSGPRASSSPSGTPSTGRSTVHRAPSRPSSPAPRSLPLPFCASTTSITRAIRPGQARAITVVSRAIRSAVRGGVPARGCAAGRERTSSTSCPVPMSSPRRTRRPSSRWTASPRRYRPAINSCAKTRSWPIAIPHRTPETRVPRWYGECAAGCSK